MIFLSFINGELNASLVGKAPQAKLSVTESVVAGRSVFLFF